MEKSAKEDGGEEGQDIGHLKSSEISEAED